MAKRLLVICTLLCLDLFVFVLIYESNVEDSVKASTTFYENVIALTFDDDVIIGLSQEISYKEAVSMI